MTRALVESRAWFEQAASDLRTAEALRRRPAPMEARIKGGIRELLDRTPGAQGKHAEVVNTEYPWRDGNHVQTPVGAVGFGDQETLDGWVYVASRVTNGLRKLWVAVESSVQL